MKESEMKKKICPEYSGIVTLYDGLKKKAIIKEIEINCKGSLCAAWAPETIVKQDSVTGIIEITYPEDSGHCPKMTGK